MRGYLTFFSAATQSAWCQIEWVIWPDLGNLLSVALILPNLLKKIVKSSKNILTENGNCFKSLIGLCESSFDETLQG